DNDCHGLRHLQDRRGPRGHPPRLRRDAHHRRGDLGAAERPRHGPRGPQAPARARCRLHRHRRLIRPVHLRGPHRRGAASLRRDRRRDEGRPHPHRSAGVALGRPPGVPAFVPRAQPAPARRRHDRPLAAAPHRRPGRARRAVRGARRRAEGGQGQAPRPLGGLRRRDQGGAGALRRRDGAEHVQPQGPRLRGRPGLLRGAGHRVHPVVPAAGGQARRARRPGRRDREGPRRDDQPGRAGVAAPALAGDAADPRDGLRRAPRGERRRRRPAADRRRDRRARRGRL
ncbi:MAG: Putative oxidoreductase, partial [uncultured Solirubrobacteraceae bacterium]